MILYMWYYRFMYHFMWRLIVHRRGSSVKMLPFCPRDKGQSWGKGQGQVQQNGCQASLVCSVVTSSLSGNCLTSGLVVWVQDLAWIQITILVGYFHCVEFESHTHKYNYQNSQGLVCMCVYSSKSLCLRNMVCSTCLLT